MCVDNCWIIYRQLGHEKVSLEDFIMQLACEMVNEYANEAPNQEEGSPKFQQSSLHLPDRLEKNERCKNCAQNCIDSKTPYYCIGCQEALNVDSFLPFHHVVE